MVRKIHRPVVGLLLGRTIIEVIKNTIANKCTRIGCKLVKDSTKTSVMIPSFDIFQEGAYY